MCLVYVFLMIKKADNVLNNNFLIRFLSLLYSFCSVFIQKKADLVGPAQSKLSVIFITVVPFESSVHYLKSHPSMFQKIYFKHMFLSNPFQTALF